MVKEDTLLSLRFPRKVNNKNFPQDKIDRYQILTTKGIGKGRISFQDQERRKIFIN